MRGADADVPLSEQVLLELSSGFCDACSFRIVNIDFRLRVCRWLESILCVRCVQTLAQALATAKEHFARSLLK